MNKCLDPVHIDEVNYLERIDKETRADKMKDSLYDNYIDNLTPDSSLVDDIISDDYKVFNEMGNIVCYLIKSKDKLQANNITLLNSLNDVVQKAVKERKEVLKEKLLQDYIKEIEQGEY